MINSVNFTIENPDGTEREIDIAARHRDPKGYGFEWANLYALTDIETEAYLGFMEINEARTSWTYNGLGLTYDQQEQIGEFILTYEDPDPN